MQKKDMVKDLAVKYNISQAESKRIFDAIFDQLSEVLSQGDYFTEAGFGTFTVAHVKKRKGYNPMIQKLMMLPPKLKPKFKSSDILKAKVNGWNDDTVIVDDDSDDEDDNNAQFIMQNAQSQQDAEIPNRVRDDSGSSAELNEQGSISSNSHAELDSASPVILETSPVISTEAEKSNDESEMVTAEEQSALMSDENEEAANV